MLSNLSCVRLFVTLWTVAHQAPLSMGLFKQEHWSGLLCPPPGGLPNPGIEPTSPAVLALQVSSLLLSLQGSPYFTQNSVYKLMLPSQFVQPSHFPPTVSTNRIHKALNFFFCHALQHVGLVPWPAIKPITPALGAWSLKLWTSREVPRIPKALYVLYDNECQ